MKDDVRFRILFLGENPSWSKLSQATTGAPEVPLHLHRACSPSEAFRVLSARNWDALSIDLHAWSFQGLISLQKIRSEYPTMPLIALMYPAVKDLEKKAVEAGASRCLNVEQVTAWRLHDAVASVAKAKKRERQPQKGPRMHSDLRQDARNRAPGLHSFHTHSITCCA